MNVPLVEFGSYLTYAPWGTENNHYESKSVKRELKENRATQTEPPFSERIVNKIKHNLSDIPFSDFFDQNPWLVPIPRSSQQDQDALWVPREIAIAMQSLGLGQSVECLWRQFPVPTSHTGPAANRDALQHYKSMAVKPTMPPPPLRIVLVDEIITSGATSLGAVNRIKEAFPEAHVRVFAVMRTISNSSEFRTIVDPCIGRITLRDDYRTFRRP